MDHAPSSIDRYVDLRPLGQGGMGMVWIARDPQLDRDVVLKGLRADLPRDGEFRERLLREARSLARLDHPNIVQIYDLIRHEDRWYLCMQRVEGRTLREVMAEGPMSFAAIQRIGAGIAAALDSAHRAGIVHRDVKPENVIVTPSGDARLLDFGVAWSPEDLALTSSDVSVGTLFAMAPEQFAGHAPDPRSDLFSVGSLIYEMATGRHPFAGRTSPEVAYAIANVPPPGPGTLRAALPFELVHAISKCLEKDPALRYQSAAELGADLGRLERELKGGAPDVAIEGVQVRSRSPRSAATPASVPALPPVPSRVVLRGLSALGVLCIIVLALFRPGWVRDAENVRMTSAAAVKAARELVGRQGSALYGFRSHISHTRDKRMRAFLITHHPDAEQRVLVERWRPRHTANILLASADREEKYEVSLDERAHVVNYRHRLRPDAVTTPVSLDSAAMIARTFVEREMEFDLRLLEALPPARRLENGRELLDFAWRPITSMPFGAKASVVVGLSGGDVVEAASGMQPSPTDAPQRRVAVTIVSYIWFILGVVSLGFSAWSMARNGAWIWPDQRFRLVVLIASTSMFLISQMEDILRIWIDTGPGSALGNVFGFACLGAMFGLVQCSLWPATLGVLGARDPRMIPSLGSLPRLRISRLALARTMVVALPLAALAAALSRMAPWLVVVSGIGTYHAEPEFWSYLADFFAGPMMLWVLLSGLIAGAAMLLDDRKWRGVAIVCALVLLTVLMENDQTYGTVALFLTRIPFALVLAVALFRFGLLAACMTFSFAGIFETAANLASQEIPEARLASGLVFALGLAALVASWIALRAPRPREIENSGKITAPFTT